MKPAVSYSTIAVEINTAVLAEKNMLGETQTPGSPVSDFSGTEISQQVSS